MQKEVADVPCPLGPNVSGAHFTKEELLALTKNSPLRKLLRRGRRLIRKTYKSRAPKAQKSKGDYSYVPDEVIVGLLFLSKLAARTFNEIVKQLEMARDKLLREPHGPDTDVDLENIQQCLKDLKKAWAEHRRRFDEHGPSYLKTFDSEADALEAKLVSA